MAKLESVLLVRGGVGNLSFYKTQDGYVVRRKYGPSASRIRTESRYQRTRENNAEFAEAGKATKLVRSAFEEVVRTMADNRVSGRLTRELVKVIGSDSRNVRGERKVADGDATLLRDFQFNADSALGKSLDVPVHASVESSTNTAVIEVDGFNPSKVIKAPEGATHFVLRSTVSVIDFRERKFHTTTSQTAALPVDAPFQTALRLEHSLGEDVSGPVFVALGIEFGQEINGVSKPLLDETHNAVAIVHVAERSVPDVRREDRTGLASQPATRFCSTLPLAARGVRYHNGVVSRSPGVPAGISAAG